MNQVQGISSALRICFLSNYEFSVSLVSHINFPPYVFVLFMHNAMPFLLILFMLDIGSVQTFALLWKHFYEFSTMLFLQGLPLCLPLSELHSEAWVSLSLSFSLASDRGDGGNLRLYLFFTDLGKFPASQSTPSN